MTAVLDLMPRLTDPLQRDMTLRWAPTGTQIDSAKILLADHGPRARVIVALVLLGKTHGFWTTDIEVRPVDGAWLVTDEHNDSFQTREDAIAAAESALGHRAGTVSWCVIKPDGSWYLFEA